MGDTLDGVGRPVPRPSRRRTRAVRRTRSPRTGAISAATSAFCAKRDIVAPEDVDESTIRSFVASISASTWGDEERPYSARSVARALSSVRSFHRFLLREGAIDRDPASAVVQPKLPRSLPHPLAVDEVVRLLEAPDVATPVGLRDRAILEVLYGAGLRISELVGLDVDDVDLEEGFVRVLGKGGKEREVPLGAFARDAVTAYLTRARPVFASKASRAALFLNQRGGRLTRQSCARLLAACVDGRRDRAPGHAAYAAPFLRHAPARRRRRRSRRAGAAGPRERGHHADLHVGDQGPPP